MTRSEFVNLSSVRLHYLSAGDGPAIVFVHGFPEFSGAWAPQFSEFARDHRVLAPDLRGFNLSDKPLGIAHYDMRVLVQDLREFIETVAGGPCVVVAHDWGGLCAWHLAAQHPECITRLVILNSPHPAMLHRELLHSAAQREAMRHTLLFRSARAEALLSENDYARLAAMFESWEIGGVALAPEFVAAYKQAWSQPGALDAMLNYYRATQLHPPGPGEPGVEAMSPPSELWRVAVPTREIWGERDGALLPALLDGLEAFVPRLQVCRLPEGTHWIAHEFPARVNALIREFVDDDDDNDPARD